MTDTTQSSQLPNLISRIDRVWLTIAVLLGLLALLAPLQAWSSFWFAVESLVGTGPYLIASIAIAAAAKASGADNLIARAFDRRVLPAVFIAAVFGGLSPFCSCGVIPLILALLTMGVPLAPVMAFWLASPVMDPSMFIMTAGLIDLPFAIGKTLAAIGIGTAGGLITYFLQDRAALRQILKPGIGDGGCGGSVIRTPKPVMWRFWNEAPRRRKFATDALHNINFLGKWLILAFLLESLMVAYVPDTLIARFVGGEGWPSVVVATLVGIPAYLNGYAALPLVSGLLQQGMNPGAGMAFLVAGGITSIPAAMAVFAIARIPVFLAYLVFAISGSIAAGLLFGALA